MAPEIQVGQQLSFGALGTTYKVLSKSLGGAAAIIEHTVEPKSLGAPLHKHTHEDETSYVLEGQLSVIQDGEVQLVNAGEYVVKPRGRFHTFWNAGENRVRFIEVITPGQFEQYFAEIAACFLPGRPPALDKIAEIMSRYGLAVDPFAADAIIKKYGLMPMG